MKTIYKYRLGVCDHQEITLPKNFETLAVKNQNGQLVLWAHVDDQEPDEKVKIRIVGTGHPFEDRQAYLYLDTVLMDTGLVWHVFRRAIP